MRAFNTLFAAALCLGVGATAVQSHENDVQITRTDTEVCITSNGSPNHDIGRFPNSGNPNRFRAQTVRVCVDATPAQTGRITENTQSSGISLTGILFRPGTADYYDASSPRGHSRNPSSGWNLEGMGSADTLGMDAENAHVDHRGLYHYHGVSPTLVRTTPDTQIGFAADGFEIHYIGDGARSSWQLRDGTRSTPPGGAFDGRFEEDWVFVAGSGNLDQCNAAMIDGTLTYFATDTFPFFPRCFHGTVSTDFMGRR